MLYLIDYFYLLASKKTDLREPWVYCINTFLVLYYAIFCLKSLRFFVFFVYVECVILASLNRFLS